MREQKKQGHTPLVLIILDGWGIAPKTRGNAIACARTPSMDHFRSHYPYTELAASGKAVGLPNRQDGNSEVGHMNIGAGRVVEQDAVTISKAIADGTFFKNTALLDAVKHAQAHKSHIHVMGLLTNHNSAHANPDHLYALLDFLHIHYGKSVYLHLFTDGRDTPPRSSIRFLEKLMHKLHDNDTISTITGRYYAMDRIKNWDRTRAAFNAMVLAEGNAADNPFRAITEAYNRGETDEFITPTVIVNPKRKSKFISDDDAVIFFNLRSDRARQITKPFVQRGFDGNGFTRKKKLKNILFVAFTDFGSDLDSVVTAFPPQVHRNTLPYALDGLRQLYVAEREKFAHVTYFFSGGTLSKSPLVANKIMVSKRVRTYDKEPRMSLMRIQTAIRKAVGARTHDFIAVNVANPDMVAHTGNIKATIRAVEYVDSFLKSVYTAVMKQKGTMLITADHGNAEELINLQTQEVDTEHSGNPVPFCLLSHDPKLRRVKLRKNGRLADIAPTILKILDLKKPSEMTGRSLF